MPAEIQGAISTANLTLSGTLTASNVSASSGYFSATLRGPYALTGGSLTGVTNSNGYVTSYMWEQDWTNTDVTTLGAVLSGTIKICTIPAKVIVRNAYVLIKTAAGGVTTLTVGFGRTGATYIDYIKASDAKAAANTLYGAVSGDRGTNLTGYDVPSVTAATDIYCIFTSTGTNLNTVTTSTGTFILLLELFG